MEGAQTIDPAVDKLRALVRIPTISHRDASLNDVAAFDRFVVELERQFPLLHERLELTRVDTHGLLFRLPGHSADRPVVLMAHLDVVPVDDGSPWRFPPFSAEIHDGAVWGRGTLDDKGALVAVCEATERLLEEDFIPQQDVWLSFGCNEEVSGEAAQLAVAELRQRGVEPWFVVDEGGAIAGEALPGLVVPLGVVGVTEKGTTSIELTAEGRGGHASTPARNGPTVRLAKALTRLDASAMPSRLPETTVEMFRRTAPHLPGPIGALLRRVTDIAQLRPLLAKALVAAGPEPAALVRTTFAITTLSGSPAINVIAATAKAGINARVMVGDSVADAVAHVRKVIKDDEIRIEVTEVGEPSPVSPVDDDAFRLVEATIQQTFPDAVVTPYVMMAATDSRFFTEICPRVYRFMPFRMSKAQRQAIHSYDEHLGIETFLEGIDWYRRLIEGLPA
ncbi:M20/M25/M40 family metallo-hydrolase [Nocardioides daejeonensis]|uniref:M20/M25/M40 family metallo-hydrolase n=1 Tax=Nocardioides daejeonensis TaxID=1046556 RepID=UPI000D744489|nr:M20/M25/M40 family metallo-hydrolase [Nocardioides daejeonensis]